MSVTIKEIDAFMMNIGFVQTEAAGLFRWYEFPRRPKSWEPAKPYVRVQFYEARGDLDARTIFGLKAYSDYGAIVSMKSARQLVGLALLDRALLEALLLGGGDAIAFRPLKDFVMEHARDQLVTPALDPADHVARQVLIDALADQGMF